MTDFPLYKAELDAGLGEIIRANAKVSYAAVPRLLTAPDCSTEQLKALASLKHLALTRSKGQLGDFDLHYLDTILVTTGWNRNDDVFDGIETFVARKTPEDKPLNRDHDCARIVGHITNSWLMGEDSKPVADDTALDDLPSKFHIVSGAVVYKEWDKPELQEEIDTLLAEIAKGEWFVSMECLFKGFDYALRDKAGNSKVVARNKDTAFLTKHLRTYGGTGAYGEYKVGRLLRNIVFSGKGFVKKPANPESIIFPETTTFSPAKATIENDFEQVSAEQVYSQTTETKNQESLEMSATIESLKAELDATKAENEKLKNAQAEEFKTKLAVATEDKAKADELLVKAGEALKAEQEKLATVAKELEAAKATVAEIQSELKNLHADAITKDRIAVAKEKLKFNDEDAGDFVKNSASLNAEQFGKQVELMAKAFVTNNPVSGNTSFPGPTAATPPKATSHPVGPQSTSATKGGEEDKSGEAAVEGADLSKAEGTEAALATVSASAGVSDVQKQIAAYLGATAEVAE